MGWRRHTRRLGSGMGRTRGAGAKSGRRGPRKRQRRDFWSRGRVDQTEPGALSAGLTMTAGSADFPWIASYTSWRWTGTSFGATMPRRTLSPRISTTVIVMSLLITIDSFFFLDRTSIAAYPSQSQGGRSWLLVPTRSPGSEVGGREARR